MKIRKISESNDCIYKKVEFSLEESKKDYIELIDKLLKDSIERGKYNIFYTNINNGGVNLKNDIVEKIDGILEAGFVKRKNGKVYFKIMTIKNE